MSQIDGSDSDEEPDVADALFLPPCVLKARRGQPKHWAQPAQGWRPITEPPPVVAQRALPADAPKDLYPRRKQEQSIGEDHEQSHSLADLFEAEEPAPVVGETLDVDSEDDPFEYEVLSPEEAKAKTEIWDELNKDIAPMLSKKDSAAKRRQARQEEELQQKEEEKRLAEESVQEPQGYSSWSKSAGSEGSEAATGALPLANPATLMTSSQRLRSRWRSIFSSTSGRPRLLPAVLQVSH
ncbi:unnamed protein product [Effrenium voratum]|nr:unnamed protein product [Effrenium voratum]